MEFKSIPHAVFATAKKQAQQPAYHFKRDGAWVPVSWTDYASLVRKAAKAFIHLGFAPGSACCIISISRPEWTIADVAAMAAGGVPAGLYPTSSPTELSYIVNHSEAPVLFVENDEQLAKVSSEKAAGNLPKLKHVIIFEGAGKDGAIPWSKFLELSNGVSDSALEERLASLKEDGLATFIYTSGTTGPPKGVMLSNRNLVSSATIVLDHLLHANSGDRAISYLPLSHIAEQLCTILVPAVSGTSVYYSEGLPHMPRNLTEVQPTIFFAPPRFWEKFYAALKAKIPDGVPASKIPEASKAEMRKAIGMNQTKVAISGAAPISLTVLEFFRDFVGLQIQEVFGQSESTGLASVSCMQCYKPGTVGKAFPQVQIKLAEEDSEILLRGPIVSLGYYKDRKNTEETFDANGWLHTGDLGTIDSEGYLSITGRKKDIVITAGGENIAAPRIEKSIEVHPLVQNAVVVGDQRPYLTALVTLDPEVVEKVTEGKVPFEKFAASPKARQVVQEVIDKVNSGLARVSTVKRFLILPRPFTIQTGEVTPTMKVKRAFVYKTYAKEIEQLYQEAKL